MRAILVTHLVNELISIRKKWEDLYVCVYVLLLIASILLSLRIECYTISLLRRTCFSWCIHMSRCNHSMKRPILRMFIIFTCNLWQYEDDLWKRKIFIRTNEYIIYWLHILLRWIMKTGHFYANCIWTKYRHDFSIFLLLPIILTITWPLLCFKKYIPFLHISSPLQYLVIYQTRLIWDTRPYVWGI